MYILLDVHSSMRVSGEGWVLANTNVSGFFRVNYDANNWARLLSLLNADHKVSPSTARSQWPHEHKVVQVKSPAQIWAQMIQFNKADFPQKAALTVFSKKV